MKRTVLAAFATLCFSQILAAVPLLPFIERGKSWHILEYDHRQLMFDSFDELPYREYDLEFCEDCDTVINGMCYAKLTHTNVCGEDVEQVAAIVREEEGKVYEYYNGKEWLMYDFTLNKGDKIELRQSDGQQLMTVDDVSYTDLNGRSLRTITLSGTAGEWADEPYTITRKWIEGVGDTQNPLSEIGYAYEAGGGCLLMPYVTWDSGEFLPLSFRRNNYCGQQLKLGENIEGSIPVEKWGKDELQYEFVDEKTLHAYGVMWLSDCSSQYIYCYCHDTGSECAITTKVKEVGIPGTRLGAYKVDLFFGDFFNEGTYSITDNSGKHVIGDKSWIDNCINQRICDESADSHVYNISGQYCHQFFHNGIYIKKGSKRIVK